MRSGKNAADTFRSLLQLCGNGDRYFKCFFTGTVPSADIFGRRREHFQVAERPRVLEAADILVADLRNLSLRPVMQLVQRPLPHRLDDRSKYLCIVLLVRGLVQGRRPLLRHRGIS